MKTKDQVLNLLEKSGHSYISGQKIAEELSLSRAAVWKAIKSLEKEGCQIEAVTNKGYRLIQDPEKTSAAAISKILDNTADDLPDNLKIIVYDTVTSTNDLAKEYSVEHPNDEVVITADCQTKGKGRRGRSFYSPEKTGMYMSFLLHPNADISKVTHLTCVMAAALCNAIEETTGISTDIKWVNDVYYKNKKISGILTEGQTSLEDGHLSYVVIGVGVNLFMPSGGFPDDIKDKAGALLDSDCEIRSASDSDIGIRNRLYAAIIRNFFKYYNDPDEKSYISEYKRRSMLIGSRIRIINYNDSIKGTNREYAFVTGIDDECHLLVEFDDGSTAELSNGEVSVVKQI